MTAMKYAIPILCGLSATAFAQQPPTSPRLDPGDKIMREQMEQERERLLRQKTPQIDIERIPSATDIDPTDITDPEPTFLIERIELHGADLLTPEQIEPVTAPFRGLRLGVNRINLLLSRLNRLLIDSGYITSRAYVADQSLASGVLHLTIVAGKIEKLRYNGQELPADGRNLPGVRLSLPFAAGDTLQLRDLEQGIDQLNRLRANQADVKILPGETPGGSIVDITNRQSRLWQGSLAADNQGSSTTGSTRYRANIAAGDLLGLMESINLGYTGSLETNAVNGSIAIPFGYSTVTLLGTWSEYQNLIEDTALLYGTSRNSAISWNHQFFRDKSTKAAVDISLSHRQAKREINNVALMPQKLTVARIGVNRLTRFSHGQRLGQWTIDTGLAKGLTWLNADRDAADLPTGAARAQFTKLDASASIMLPLADILSWRSNLTAQWSRTPLFSSEQIFAGGVSSVRGFNESAAGGDKGLVLRNELAIDGLPPVWGKLKAEPFVFLDAARVAAIADNYRQSLVSLGLGARINLAAGGLEIIVGRPISKPANLAKTGSRLDIALTWMF